MQYDIFIFFELFKSYSGVTPFIKIWLSDCIYKTDDALFSIYNIGCGRMAHLTLRTKSYIGSVEKIYVSYPGSVKPLSINRVVVKDPVNNDVALFLPNEITCITKEYRRVCPGRELKWHESVVDRFVRGVGSWLFSLAVLVPPQASKIKFDRSLVYALGMVIWAIIWILFASTISPDTFRDECVEGAPMLVPE